MSVYDLNDEDVALFLGRLRAEVNYDVLSDIDTMLDSHFTDETNTS